MNTPVQTVQQRPAESAAVAGSVALLAAHLLGVTDPTTITSLAVVLGFVPSAVTWLVTTIQSNRKPAPVVPVARPRPPKPPHPGA